MTTALDIFERGAELITDFVSTAEEETFLFNINDSDWEALGGKGLWPRRVQHYGYRYDYQRRVSGADLKAPPFPAWAGVMAYMLRKHFDGLPTQCIINEYKPGQGIGMHTDAPSFGPVVATVSLGGAWPMRFRPKTGQQYSRNGEPDDQVVVLPRRSALILTGRARTSWMHGIDPADTKDFSEPRVSMTFRTLKG